MHGCVSAAGAVAGTCVVGTHVPVTAGCGHFWKQSGWLPHTRAAARQTEDPTASQLRHISGRLAAIAGRRYTENTCRETNEDRDNCGDMELGTHSWKSCMLKGGSLWLLGNPEWAGTTLRDCGNRWSTLGKGQLWGTVANRQNCKGHEEERKTSKNDRWPKEYQ